MQFKTTQVGVSTAAPILRSHHLSKLVFHGLVRNSGILSRGFLLCQLPCQLPSTQRHLEECSREPWALHETLLPPRFQGSCPSDLGEQPQSDGQSAPSLWSGTSRTSLLWVPPAPKGLTVSANAMQHQLISSLGHLCPYWTVSSKDRADGMAAVLHVWRACGPLPQLRLSPQALGAGLLSVGPPWGLWGGSTITGPHPLSSATVPVPSSDKHPVPRQSR